MSANLRDEWFGPAVFPFEAESALLEQFFADTPTGFFVDVGANDPVVYSQTHALEQRGWTGVLVEPLPDKAAQLRESRKAQVYQVACSRPQDEGQPLSLLVAGRLSSIRPRLVAAGVAPADRITVQAMTLDSILTKANAPTPVDFVSIDVEGHEVEVLEGFDLARWRPRLLLVEDHAMSLDLHRHLTAHGYKWFRRTDLNGWYVPKETNPTVSLFGRWQFLRKYYLSLPFRHARDFKRRILNRPVQAD